MNSYTFSTFSSSYAFEPLVSGSQKLKFSKLLTDQYREDRKVRRDTRLEAGTQALSFASGAYGVLIVATAAFSMPVAAPAFAVALALGSSGGLATGKMLSSHVTNNEKNYFLYQCYDCNEIYHLDHPPIEE